MCQTCSEYPEMGTLIICFTHEETEAQGGETGGQRLLSYEGSTQDLNHWLRSLCS